MEPSGASRRLLLRGLRHCGVEREDVLEAADATTALTLAAAHRPGIVLAAQELADMAGAQLVGGLLTAGHVSRGALLAADLSAAALTAATQAGVPMLLPKPFHQAQLAAALAGELAPPAAWLTGAPPAGPVLPTARDVERLLVTLLDRTVELHGGAPVLPRPGQRAMVAAYVDRRLRTVAVLAADVPLCIALAGAFELDPEDTVAQALRRTVLPAQATETLHELARLCARLFTPVGGAALSLFALAMPGRQPETPTTRALVALRRRLDVGVEVHGYGGGGLSLVVPG